MPFLNLDTKEYPRFQGDIDLEPDANWVEVKPTAAPEPAEGNTVVWDDPIEIKGVWTMTWKQIPIEKPTKETEIAKAKLFGIDLKLLGVIDNG